MTAHPPRRLVLLCAVATGLGLAAGLAAWLLVRLIAVLTNAAQFHRWGTTLPSYAHLRVSPLVVVVAVLGATAVTLLARWAPVIRGHGIPETMDAVLTRRSRVSPRTAVAKPLSAALAIGTGGPFGAEGPIIVTGGSLGSLAGQVLHVSANERKILLACGAAAGMAATFGTPLAAVVLAIELLLFEFSPRALIPLAVATSVAGGVHALLFGNGPLFSVPAHGFTGLGQLPLFAALGLACGLLAVMISRGLFAFEHLFARLPLGEAWHPVVGAVAWASLALLVPRTLGVGYDVIGDALAGRLALATLAALAVGKLVVWWTALASGTSGGTLAPILLVSACVGALTGQLVSHALPGHGLAPSAFALVAMAATFGAAARAPFAAIVFVFELTRDYDAVLPLMLATVLADLVARALLPQSIMTEKLARRGITVPSAFHADPLLVTPVGAVMSRDVVCVAAGADLRTALLVTQGSLHRVFPVVDGDRVVTGIVDREDLVEAADPTTPVEQVAARNPVTVDAAASLQSAVALMVEEGIDHLPVVEGGRLVGICTRSDVLSARARHLEHERVETGWLPVSRNGHPAPAVARRAER